MGVWSSGMCPRSMNTVIVYYLPWSGEQPTNDTGCRPCSLDPERTEVNVQNLLIMWYTPIRAWQKWDRKNMMWTRGPFCFQEDIQTSCHVQITPSKETKRRQNEKNSWNNLSKCRWSYLTLFYTGSDWSILNRSIQVCCLSPQFWARNIIANTYIMFSINHTLY